MRKSAKYGFGAAILQCLSRWPWENAAANEGGAGTQQTGIERGREAKRRWCRTTVNSAEVPRGIGKVFPGMLDNPLNVIGTRKVWKTMQTMHKSLEILLPELQPPYGAVLRL
jgi:hypothetical protein